MDNQAFVDPGLEAKLSVELIPLARAMIGSEADIAAARKVNPAWCLRPISANAYARLANAPNDAIAPMFLDLGASDEYMKVALSERDNPLPSESIVEKMREWWVERTEQAWIKKLVDAKTIKEKQQWSAALKRLYQQKRSGVYVVDMANPSPPQEYLMIYQDIAYRPRGDLSVLKAKKKSGKSTFLKIEVACMISESGMVHGMSRSCLPGTDIIRPPLKVLWLDTEQSFASSDLCYRQVLQMAGLPLNVNSPNLRMVNSRMNNPDERLAMLEEEVYADTYDVVILDGIKDVAKDINDPSETDMIVSKVLQILQDTKVAFIAVIHENPAKDSDKMRGWLGTEIGNKAFEIQDVKHNAKTGIFTVSNPDRRGKNIPPYGFRFDEDDMLEQCEPEAEFDGQGQGQKRSQKEIVIDNEQKAINQVKKAFEDNPSLQHTHDELVRRLMSRTTVNSPSTAGNRIKKACSVGVLRVVSGEQGKRGAQYALAPQVETEINIYNQQQIQINEDGSIPDIFEGPQNGQNETCPY